MTTPAKRIDQFDTAPLDGDEWLLIQNPVTLGYNKASASSLTSATSYTKIEVDTSLAGKAAAIHVHAISDVTGLQAALDGKSATGHTHTAANVTDFDTEVSNNTDVAANTAARHTHANSAVLNDTTASFTTADETKLDGIAAGAQVNTVTSVNTRTGAVTGLAEASDLTAHTGNTSNPHSVTKAQVGLSNVDNTSDANKPVSTAQAAADATKLNWTASPIFLSSAALQIATGAPSMLTVVNDSIYIPGWSVSGSTAGQSLGGVVTGLPNQCHGVKIELLTSSSNNATGLNHVWQVYSSQPEEGESISLNQILNTPRIKSSPPLAKTFQSIVLEEYLPVDPSRDLFLRVARHAGDVADTWTGSVVVAGLKVTPVLAPPDTIQIQESLAYNSWPMITTAGTNLVCCYSRGLIHEQPDTTRQIWGTISSDGGSTWSTPTLKIDNTGIDDSAVGIGHDSAGNILLWTRQGTASNVQTQSLYKSTDNGNTFTLFSSPSFAVPPIQITDTFSVPTVGLMAFWHGASTGSPLAWGVVTSGDDGATWTQTTVETGLGTDAWPTEISGVYVGGGKILAIGRTNSINTTTIKSQFQITSSDYGATWTKVASNITDINISTPSLLYDESTDTISMYYYRRGQLHSLRRRAVSSSTVFTAPLKWPDPTIVATGGAIPQDSGNANATSLNDKHIVAFYDGNSTDTGIYVSIVDNT